MTVFQGPSGNASRRTFVAAVGAAGLSAALAACGGSKDDSGGKKGDVLGATSDIPEGGGKIFADEKVVVTQPRKGEFKAFSNICTHQRCPVASVEGGTINCTCHGSKFDIADGSVRHEPATKPLPPKKITVSGGKIKLA
ncbi:Rieske (2Fe-2S) protein [Streptomyces tsukubensis]|uniref:Cytochrome bc1 complex Rieske iron-sulfur subunit n=1 Tax=Streptomyces tsukubensis TaxID=83656 RepID=A0A1V4A6R7_9ACTN|nr:Rieske (2Fe-2S) protein [Streptomyces tsukubensis]OON77374.1 (2Fe-2S)-binding protein [Streptomyces tsukubensis]QFR92455.1 Rieske 2Fe-2S domain-containing protein [Streptomyces tsukubensis]